MGKTLTRAIGASFALALAGATFSPAIANAEDNGEVSVPRTVDISEAENHDNGINSISIVAGTDDDGEYTESLEISSTSTATTTADGGVDWHCRSFLAADGTVPDDLADRVEDGLDENLLSGIHNDNHGDGNELQVDTFDTSDLEDGTYTVASACFGGVWVVENDGDSVVSGTQEFTLSTPATGSLEDLGLGSLDGGSLGGGSSDSLGGGSAGDSGSAAAVGSLVLGGGIAAGIHAHNMGVF